MENKVIQFLSNDEDIINDLKDILNHDGIQTGSLTKEYPNDAKFDPNQIAVVISKIAVVITSGESILKAIGAFIKQWKKVKETAGPKHLEIKVGSKVLDISGAKDENELKSLLTDYLKNS